MKLRVILTGATGMVGEGVLHECLSNPDVEAVLVIGRRPCGVNHPKLSEVIHADLAQAGILIKKLEGYNACFFCAGVSAVGMSAEAYHRLTYDLVMGFAGHVAHASPEVSFCYLSGKGTDSTEAGRMMWARVKGKTENALLRLPFRSAYMFRAGYMHPTKGLKNTLRAVKAVAWLYPVLRPLFPGSVCTLREVGLAMIKAAQRGPEKRILEVRDIVALASESNDADL